MMENEFLKRSIFKVIMNGDTMIPPNISEILSPRLGTVLGNRNSHDFSVKKLEVAKDSCIVSEQKEQIRLYQQIIELSEKAAHRKKEKLLLLGNKLKSINAKVAEQEAKTDQLESMRDKILKEKYDKLYEIKTENSETLAKIQETSQLNIKIEQENTDLSTKKQQMASAKLFQIEKCKISESSLIASQSNLSHQTEKLLEFLEIKKCYEESFENYKKERLNVYQEAKRLNNYLQELKGNIRVFCKIRPILPDEKSALARLDINERAITIYKGEKPSTFKFDRVFSPNADIDEVFEEISQLVQSALDGYKVCIFAYGQTGSGKTYTMEGSNGGKSKGIIQKSVELMFATSNTLSGIGWDYTFSASIIEIYNEQVRDLLDGSRILTGVSSSIINPEFLKITSYADLIPILAKARKQRAEAGTECNINSSRSHSLFQLRITGKKGNETNNGVLNLIDLAGSERLKVSKAEGDRLEETKAINKSLSALGGVIHALAKKEKHIPYRDSKLTYLLQNCLGGDGKTLMFVNISPVVGNSKETWNSLVFAQKVNGCSLNN